MSQSYCIQLTQHTPQVTDLNVFVLAQVYCEQVYCDHWLKVA